MRDQQIMKMVDELGKGLNQLNKALGSVTADVKAIKQEGGITRLRAIVLSDILKSKFPDDFSDKIIDELTEKAFNAAVEAARLEVEKLKKEMEATKKKIEEEDKLAKEKNIIPQEVINKDITSLKNRIKETAKVEAAKKSV